MSVQSAAAAIASGQIGPVHYPDCYIGQRFGPGFVSFDECISAVLGVPLTVWVGITIPVCIETAKSVGGGCSCY